MFRRCLIILWLAAVAFGGPRAFSSDEVSVLTWNLWGIPWLTPSASARIDAGLEVILRRSPDVICLQEIWGRGDVDRVRERLLAAGYLGVRHFPSWPFGSGLMIASRFPILDSGFHRYRHQGKFYKPWHGDWYAGKGIGWVELEVAGKKVRILNTHLHARVARPSVAEYLPTRLMQTMDLIDALERHGRTGAALVLCGDLNMRLGELPMRVLLDFSAMRMGPTEGNLLDWILLQDGAGEALRFHEYRIIPSPVFEEGKAVPVSDHPFVIARIGIEKGGEQDASGVIRIGSNASTKAELKAVLQEARLDAQRSRHGLLMGTGGIAIFGVGLAVLAGSGLVRRPGTRWRRWALPVVVVIGGGLALHFCHCYHYEKALEATMARLAEWGSGSKAHQSVPRTHSS